MPDALPDLWTTIDYPVLLEAARLQSTNGRPVTSAELAEGTGLDVTVVVRAIGRLAQRYVEVRSVSSLAATDYLVTGVTADGLEAAGQWPSPEVAADRILAALDAAIDDTTEGSPKQGRLKAARDAVASIGRDLLVQVASGVITGRIPT